MANAPKGSNSNLRASADLALSDSSNANKILSSKTLINQALGAFLLKKFKGDSEERKKSVAGSASIDREVIQLSEVSQNIKESDNTFSSSSDYEVR